MYPMKVLLNPKKYKEEFVEDLEEHFKDFESEASKALIDKVKHHLLYANRDLDSIVRMMRSFNKGVKRIRGTYKYSGREKSYEWKGLGHGEYPSYGKNDPKGHFRWNDGQIYTLNEDELDEIKLFLRYTFGE